MINVIVFIGANLIAAILILWLLTYIDKFTRVNWILATMPWEPVNEFNPSKRYAFKGVYIWQKKRFIGWKTVYVGQSVNVMSRYKQHISDKGCHDIYLDYKANPAQLRFKAFSMKDAHYSDLNALEKRLILKYKTDRNGYNKTAGNGTHIF